ncbi:hypothetical protein BYT27DRAFT_7260352 [Phlegmacium glaucopus]|nr:hypothetical protein BYT27DRAFT_7260352 [Phlegmacium glaucopus]
MAIEHYKEQHSKKRKPDQSEEDSEGSESEDDERPEETPLKGFTVKKSKRLQKKKKPAEVQNSDHEISEPENDLLVTVYVHIITPALHPKSKETVTKKGPFFINIEDQTHPRLIIQLAKTIGCLSSSIKPEKLEWKLETPKNDPWKPLGDIAGFKAMIKVLKEKKRNPKLQSFAVIISTPRVRLIEGQTEMDHYEEDPGLIGNSIRAQKRYIPLAMIPDSQHYEYMKRMELNDLRIQIWAKKIQDGETTTLEPPMSVAFSEQHRIKRIPVVVEVPGSAGLANSSLQNTSPSFQSPSGFPFPPYAYPFFMPGVPSYPGFPSPLQNSICQNFPGHPSAPQPIWQTASIQAASNTHVAVAASPMSPQKSPQQIKMPRPCSLDEFCQRYDLTSRDQARLDKLEVIPGDRGVEKLSEKAWLDVGFTELSWGRFLESHRSFVSDVKNGAWV